MRAFLNRLKENGSLYQKGLVLVAALALLCTVLYAISNDTLGWFSAIRTVTGTGLVVSADAVDIGIEYGVAAERDGEITCEVWTDTAEAAFYTEGDGGLLSLFSGMCPGDKIYMAVRYTNRTEAGYLTDIFLQPGEETPEVHEDEYGSTVYAYFGSQLKVRRAMAYTTDGDETAESEVEVGRYLVPNENMRSYFTSPISAFPPTTVAEGLPLPGNGQLTVYIEIEFVDNEQDQNHYQHFGGEGACTRFIAANFIKAAS